MENLGLFYDHLVYFTAIGNILWPFGIFCRHLVYFSHRNLRSRTSMLAQVLQTFWAKKPL
jgi:hypothetical protein